MLINDLKQTQTQIEAKVRSARASLHNANMFVLGLRRELGLKQVTPEQLTQLSATLVEIRNHLDEISK